MIVRTSLFCAISGEATNTNFIVFGLIGPRIETAIYKHTKHYTFETVVGWRLYIMYIINVRELQRVIKK